MENKHSFGKNYCNTFSYDLIFSCPYVSLRSLENTQILIFGVSQRSNSIKGVLQSVKILLANKNCSHLVVSKCLQSFITC